MAARAEAAWCSIQVKHPNVPDLVTLTGS